MFWSRCSSLNAAAVAAQRLLLVGALDLGGDERGDVVALGGRLRGDGHAAVVVGRLVVGVERVAQVVLRHRLERGR
jgi:hypothetical protein